jgi:hypothetical protein
MSVGRISAAVIDRRYSIYSEFNSKLILTS